MNYNSTINSGMCCGQIGYTNIAKYNDAVGILGNGWTVDVIVEFF